MGIDSERFVKAVPQKLLWAKWGDVLVKPRQCKLWSIMVCKEWLEGVE